MEEGNKAASSGEITECWNRATRSPYIMRLALCAGIGGLLFGYDTGVISGALLYIREDFEEVDKKTWLQETIVSMAVAGAIIGAAFGGWINDKLGRKKSILISDVVFFLGAVVMAAAPAPWFASHRRPVPVLPYQFGIHKAIATHLVFQGKVEEAKDILLKIYRPGEVEEEMRAMEESVKIEKEEEELNGLMSFGEKLKGAFTNDAVRRAIALSLITSGLNAVGTIMSMIFIDRYGRRRLLLVSIVGIIVCLVITSVIFFEAASHAPSISNRDSLNFGANSTCHAYTSAPNFSSWNCMQCLHAECAFCANSDSHFLPGACLAAEKSIRGVCRTKQRVWFSKGCPSKIGLLAVIVLGVYILAYAPGMGTVPWVLNSELYPLKYRGIGGGIAAVSNWCANLIVSESFLSMTETLGTAGTFLLFAGFSVVALLAIYALVPETKGLHFEELLLLPIAHVPDLSELLVNDVNVGEVILEAKAEDLKMDDLGEIELLRVDGPEVSELLGEAEGTDGVLEELHGVED
ncbi:hypothetical protein Fmac_013705 [Flemingia macrophylla]|uniref:Major facilitator superfamily (MFS) profile domain-containing protein n=1 Tax=Flemingia macrophylla TaxID=520843 RepID=A0ABD1MTV8_9FABA